MVLGTRVGTCCGAPYFVALETLLASVRTAWSHFRRPTSPRRRERPANEVLPASASFRLPRILLPPGSALLSWRDGIDEPSEGIAASLEGGKTRPASHHPRMARSCSSG